MTKLFQRPQLSLFIIGFLLHALVFNFAQTVDADSTSRLYISHALSQHWHLISEGIWGPIHFYFNALLLTLLPYTTAIIALKWMHIAFGIWAALGIYNLTFQLFKKKENAFFAGLFVLVSPIIFRNSHHILAGVPFVAFVANSLYFMALGINSNKYWHFIFAGLLMTIAAGMRYEAWLLMALFSCIIWWNSSFLKGTAFAAFALLFPMYWMVGNYIAHDDFLYGVSAASIWNQQLEGNNEYIDNAIRLQRILFFPWSLFLGLTPPILLVILSGLVKNSRKLTRLQLSFLLVFTVVLGTYIFKAYNGTLFLQHRFSSLLIVLLVPFVGTFKLAAFPQRQRLLALFATLAIPCSFFVYQLPVDRLFGFSYTVSTALEKLIVETGPSSEAVPRLRHKEVSSFNALIKCNSKPLILDYFNWETHAYLGEISPLGYAKTFMTNGAKNEIFDTDELSNFFSQNTEGYLITGLEQKLFSTLTIVQNVASFSSSSGVTYLQLIALQHSGVYHLYSYKRLSENELSTSKKELIRLPEKDLDFYLFQLKNDGSWLTNVRKNARENNVSLENQMKNEAQWMVENASNPK